MNIDHLRSLFGDILKENQFWLVILVLVFLGANTAVFALYSGDSAHKDDSLQSLGGPVSVEDDLSDLSSGMAVTPGNNFTSSVDRARKGLVLSESAVAVGASEPFSNVVPTRNGIKKYTVQKGDTLSGIAAQFGISIDTIKLANPNIGSAISPGDELTILPVTGFLYETQESDTLEGVAAKYSIDPELIREYNSDIQNLFSISGQEVILPYAEPKHRWAYLNSQGSLPDLGDYFERPANGLNWGEIHSRNAIDIANSCGSPIYASAEGLVLESHDNGTWNDGYGNYLLVEHPNETKTKYAHTLKNLVAQGEYVLKGEKIALIGNSGNTHGATGCHLHFEVHGAQNPFAG